MLAAKGQEIYDKRLNALYGHEGIEYQKLLILKLALQAHEQQQDFLIKTEVLDHGSFDDVVFETTCKIQYFQVKHHFYDAKRQRYTFAALANITDNGHKKRVEIHHFFSSWQLIKTKQSNALNKSESFVLFSNHSATSNLKSCFDVKESRFSDAFIEGKKLTKKQANKRKLIFKALQVKCNADEAQIKEFLYCFHFELEHESRQELQVTLTTKIKHLTKTWGDHGFSIFKTRIDALFLNDKPLTLPKIQQIFTEINAARSQDRLHWHGQNQLSTVRAQAAGVTIARDELMTQLSEFKGTTLKLLTGVKGAGKTAIVKMFHAMHQGVIIYCSARDYPRLATDFTNLELFYQGLQSIGYHSGIKYFIFDDVCVDLLTEDLLSSCKSFSSFAELIFVVATDDLDAIIHLLEKHDFLKKYTVHPVPELSANELLTHFPQLMRKMPLKISRHITPFVIDKLTVLTKQELRDIDYYDSHLFLIVLELWAKKILGANYKNAKALVIQLACAKQRDTTSQKKADPIILRCLVNSNIITQDCNDFAHDHYLFWATHLYLNKVYKLLVEIDNQLQAFIDLCIQLRGSEYIFLQKFNSLATHLDVGDARVYAYIMQRLHTALQDDNSEFVRLFYAHVKEVHPLQKLPPSLLGENALALAIEKGATRCVAAMLDFIQVPLHTTRSTTATGNQKNHREDVVMIDDTDDSSYSGGHRQPIVDDQYTVAKYCYADWRLGAPPAATRESLENLEKLKKIQQNREFYLHRALCLGHQQIFKLLYFHNSKHGYTAYARNDYEETYIHLAVYHGLSEIVRWLLKISANVCVNLTDLDNETPLHNAIYADNYEMAVWLIAKGAQVDHANVVGYTPLHLAVILGMQRDSAEFVALLIKHNASTFLEDSDHHTPLQLIQEIYDKKLTADLEAACLSDDENKLMQYIRYGDIPAHGAEDSEDNDDKTEVSDEMQTIYWMLLLLVHPENRQIATLYEGNRVIPHHLAPLAAQYGIFKYCTLKPDESQTPSQNTFSPS